MASGDPRLKFGESYEFYNFLKVTEKNLIISSEDVVEFFNIEIKILV